jgi:hypothetical protein
MIDMQYENKSNFLFVYFSSMHPNSQGKIVSLSLAGPLRKKLK